MKPKARLKVTLDCNKTCSFCINNNQEYRDSWKRIEHLGKVDWKKFRSIIISGGEPTILGITSLQQYLRYLRLSAGAEPCIYLQTNGLYLTKQLVHELDLYIDGVGYSVHSFAEFEHKLTRLRDINRIKPVRLYVNSEFYHKNRGSFPVDFTYKLWTKDEFDPEEEIFVLK